MVDFTEDGWERRKNQVEEPEKVGHVERDQLHDGLRHQHPSRPNHGTADGLYHRLLAVLRNVQVRVSRLLGQTVAAFLENYGTMRLGQEEVTCDLDDTRGDGGRVEDPAPCRVFRDEASSQWTDYRAE